MHPIMMEGLHHTGHRDPPGQAGACCKGKGHLHDDDKDELLLQKNFEQIFGGNRETQMWFVMNEAT